MDFDLDNWRSWLHRICDANEIAGLPSIDAILISRKLDHRIKMEISSDHMWGGDLHWENGWYFGWSHGRIPLIPTAHLGEWNYELVSYHTVRVRHTGTVSYPEASFIRAGA